MLCRCGRSRDRPDRVRCSECRERPKRQVFEAYGGPRCIYCGCEDFDALNLEHRHNDGNIDKRRGLSGQKLYRYLKAQGYPQGRFDVACANCNIIKQIRGVDYLLKLRGLHPRFQAANTPSPSDCAFDMNCAASSWLVVAS